MFLTVLTVGVVTWQQFDGSFLPQSQPVRAEAVAQGGQEETIEQVVQESEEQIELKRQQQELLDKREQIIRFQIQSLEAQSALFGHTTVMQEAFAKSLSMLNDLLRDREQADAVLLESLRQMREAQESALALNVGSTPDVIELQWPVDPIYGVSAKFHDTAYQKIFGFAHNAVDIPVEQGTTIYAPADGIVEQYVDNGYGYSWISIRHKGYVTVYGHVTDSLVTEGDLVHQGDPIGKTGGLPGSKGAGNMTTGPHLHFELITDQGHTDPLRYLPELE